MKWPLPLFLLFAAAGLGLAGGCGSVDSRLPTDATLAIAGASRAAPVDGAKGFTHLALVIDTSGSMRDPANNKLWPVVTQAVVNILATHPEIKWIQWIDTNARGHLGPSNAWTPYARSTTGLLVALLESSAGSDGVSNPMPGLLKALALPLPSKPDEQMHICVIGDEANADIDSARQEIERLNWSDGRGGGRASISAVQVPTMNPGAQTAANFEALMTGLAKRHGGTYRLLRDRHQL